MALQEGFEPSDLLESSVFKTDAINRSTIAAYGGHSRTRTGDHQINSLAL